MLDPISCHQIGSTKIAQKIIFEPTIIPRSMPKLSRKRKRKQFATGGSARPAPAARCADTRGDLLAELKEVKEKIKVKTWQIEEAQDTPLNELIDMHTDLDALVSTLCEIETALESQ